VPFRFVATATPSPNEYIEILAYAAFLGIMDVGQAKTRFFKRNSEKADALTLHPHKEREFWLWVASWALFVQRPSDLGFSDEGYALPPLDVRWHELPSDHERPAPRRTGRAACSATPRSACRTRRARSATACRRASPSCSSCAPRTQMRTPDHLARPRGRARAIEGGPGRGQRLRLAGPGRAREGSSSTSPTAKIAELAGKPSMLGSGCNFQRHCAWAIFLGIGFKFNDFIQAIHRLQRFQQPHQVRVDLIYTEAEREVRRELERKWAQHVEQVAKMTARSSASSAWRTPRWRTRSRARSACERAEASGKTWTLVNNDCVDETRAMAETASG
jgi:hypothetical protein